MTENWMNLIFLVPIVAILSGAFKEWLSFKAKTRALGNSTSELERELAAVRQREGELIERLQNLEAIVVSQTWGALQEKGLSQPDRERKLASAARRELANPDAGDFNRQRAEQLARQLQ